MDRAYSGPGTWPDRLTARSGGPRRWPDADWQHIHLEDLKKTKKHIIDIYQHVRNNLIH